MSVSNEDRDPLVHELSMEDYMAAAVGLLGRTPHYYPNLAEAAKNWLIAHGWGPRPDPAESDKMSDVLGYVVVEWVDGQPNPANGMGLHLDLDSARSQARMQNQGGLGRRGYRFTVGTVRTRTAPRPTTARW